MDSWVGLACRGRTAQAGEWGGWGGPWDKAWRGGRHVPSTYRCGALDGAGPSGSTPWRATRSMCMHWSIMRRVGGAVSSIVDGIVRVCRGIATTPNIGHRKACPAHGKGISARYARRGSPEGSTPLGSGLHVMISPGIWVIQELCCSLSTSEIP